MSVSGPIAPLTVHPSRRPFAVQRAVARALREGRLPGDFLYASPAQARRWLAYHQAWSPSRADAGVGSLYREAFARAARSVGSARGEDGTGVVVVGVGAGGGRKDAELIAALHHAWGEALPVAYAPIDASEALALASARQGAAQPGVRAHPLVTDLAAAEAWDDLPGWLDAVAPNGPPRVVSCLGLLPNFDRHGLPRRLAELLRPGDRLLLSANLSPGGLEADRDRVVPQYDNPLARDWYAGALAELGLAEDDFRLEVNARPLEEALAEEADAGPRALQRRADSTESWIIEVEAVLLRPVTLTAGGASLPGREGMRLAVFYSQRFTARAVERLLTGAGLNVEARWLGGNGEEGVFLCRGGDAQGGAASAT